MQVNQCYAYKNSGNPGHSVLEYDGVMASAIKRKQGRASLY